MTGRLPSTVLRHIRCLVRAEQCTPSDRECLERFAARREEEAFAVLVRRHGPMVYGTAIKPVKGNPQIFQDFFGPATCWAVRAGEAEGRHFPARPTTKAKRRGRGLRTARKADTSATASP
ncbi:MAG TPA: hypothetical protein VH643_23350 [Gemmataceae bacterium]|jgi:hypothetical protein